MGYFRPEIKSILYLTTEFHISADTDVICLLFNIVDCLANCEKCKNNAECLSCYVGYRGVPDSNGIITSCVGKFIFWAFY